MESDITHLGQHVHPLLTEQIVTALNCRKIINIYDFVEADIRFLCDATRISAKNICIIKESIMKKKAAVIKNGLELYDEFVQNSAIIPSGIKNLDDFLEGGFCTGNIYEICGESQSGKTLLCYNILSNLSEQKIYYIDAKVNFSASTIKYLLEAQNRSDDYIKTKLTNILIKPIFSLNQLLQALYDIKKQLENGLKLRVIMINSLAAVYYTEETQYAYSLVNLITNVLRVLTSHFNVAIIVTNLITTWTDGTFGEVGATTEKICCGNYWRNVPDARIKINKCDQITNIFKVIVIRSSIMEEGKSCDISLNVNENLLKTVNIKF